MGNAFNALVDQYKTNVKNNIKTWSYSRVHTFFKLKRYELNLVEELNITVLDVKNATKAVMFNNITPTENVTRLLEHARMIGIPVGRNFTNFVIANWFQTIPIFINIQWQVFEHHERYSFLNTAWNNYHRDPVNNAQPTVARPPKIRNFRVIPVHDSQMKHIRIDHHQFYQMACILGAVKLAKGKRGKLVNIGKDVYDGNLSYYWGQVFDMAKIEKNCNGKEFDFAIVTDSVDCSLIVQKPLHPANEHTNEEIDEMYNNKKFTFVLGMDPGVRTWNATVRKHIQSGVEVRHNELIVLIVCFHHLSVYMHIIMILCSYLFYTGKLRD